MRQDVRSLLSARSFEAQGKTAAEFQRIIDSDTTKWQKVITTAKIKED